MRGYLFLALVVLAVAGFRLAEPVSDTDLFWQLAYGRYLASERTLVPDHAVFSWTPATNDVIYCAWLSELTLYGLHALGGLGALFALRYAAVLLCLGMAWCFARRLDVADRVETYLLLLVLLLSSYLGTLLKPELFSLVLMNAVVFCFFNFRLSEDRRWLWSLPVVMWVWANSHGMFVFGLLFLGLVSLPDRRLWKPFGACVLAVMVTPYGPGYLVQLVRDRLLSDANVLAMESVGAWDSIFAARQADFHFVEYLVVMAVALGLSAWATRRRPEYVLIVVNLVFAYFFVRHMRTSYVWPPVLVYTALWARPALPRWAGGLCVGLMLFFGGRSVYESVYHPYPDKWLGFGIGYRSPVVETEFLRRFRPGTTLCNDYNAGGYLMWALYPDYKVMIDGRAFPYRSWLEDYFVFDSGQRFKWFLYNYPADVALVPLSWRPNLANFLASPDWRCIFYGPTAAVFLREDVAFDRDVSGFAPDRFDSVPRNAGNALFLFAFALDMGDQEVAWRVLEGMRQQFRDPALQPLVRALGAYKGAVEAMERGDRPRALELHEYCWRAGFFYNTQTLAELYTEQGKTEMLELLRSGRRPPALPENAAPPPGG